MHWVQRPHPSSPAGCQKEPARGCQPHPRAAQHAATDGYVCHSCRSTLHPPEDMSDEVEHDPPAAPQIEPPRSWIKGELIGSGAFGRVYLGLNNDTGRLMAIKEVPFNRENIVAGRVARHIKALEDEIRVLQRISHPNVVQYYVRCGGECICTACVHLSSQGTCVQDNTLNIFLEYVPGGSIASLLAKFGTIEAISKQTAPRAWQVRSRSRSFGPTRGKSCRGWSICTSTKSWYVSCGELCDIQYIQYVLLTAPRYQGRQHSGRQHRRREARRLWGIKKHEGARHHRCGSAGYCSTRSHIPQTRATSRACTARPTLWRQR